MHPFSENLWIHNSLFYSNVFQVVFNLILFPHCMLKSFTSFYAKRSIVYLVSSPNVFQVFFLLSIDFLKSTRIYWNVKVERWLVSAPSIPRINLHLMWLLEKLLLCPHVYFNDASYQRDIKCKDMFIHFLNLMLTRSYLCEIIGREIFELI